MHRATREKPYLRHHNKGSETLHTFYNVEVYLRTWRRHVNWRVEQKYVQKKCTKCFLKKERMCATRYSTSGVAYLRMTVLSLIYEDYTYVNHDLKIIAIQFWTKLSSTLHKKIQPGMKYYVYLYVVCASGIMAILMLGIREKNVLNDVWQTIKVMQNFIYALTGVWCISPPQS